MGSSELNGFPKFEGSIEEAFIKLQHEYADLERKYAEAIALLNNTTSKHFDNFLSQLAKTVASLYGRSIYSDLNIKLKGKVMPVHKFVLHARSDVWQDLKDTKEFDWTDMDEDVAMKLLQWIYTDLVTLPNDCMALGLLQVANRFHLPILFAVCEKSLCDSVQKVTCIEFYCAAEEVDASALIATCSRLISMNWNTFTTKDFEDVPGSLLYKMLKNKTKYILHEAIRLQRNDVVLLFLEDNINNTDCVNSLSEEGLLPLQLALMGNNMDIIQTLMSSSKVDLNAVDHKGCTLLMDAINRGDKSAAIFLLENNCDLDLQSRETGNTALHLICSYDMKNKSNTCLDLIDVAESIISKGANVNTQNLKGETPLHLAVQPPPMANDQIFDLLLTASDINVNLLNENEESPLELLLMHSSITSFEFARKLIDLGANCNQLKSTSQDNLLQVLAANDREDAAIFLADFCDLNDLNERGLTALHIAAERNLVNLVEKLLRLGASPNMQNVKSNMNTPLHLAVISKSLKAIQALGDFAYMNQNTSDFEIPNLNLLNADGNSPLSICLSRDQLDMMPILIKSGANVNLCNNDNMNLLHMAILSLNSEAAMNLLDHGADLNALTNDGESPLQLAIKCKLPKVVDALCSRDVAHLNAHDMQEECPLWISLELEYDDLAEILVRHGIDTNCWGVKPESPYRQTLLHRAIEEGNEKAAIFLIKNHCNLDGPRNALKNVLVKPEDDDQACPIHLCCKFGAVNVLKTLIYHGVYINALDAKGQTALHTAIRHQQNEVIMILLCHPNIDLEIVDMNGYSAFAAALSLRNHKAARQILDRFPNAAEQMNSKGRNFLHLAIMKEDLESVLFLLSIKVNVNSRVQDATQSTPMHLAAALKNEMILRNLILAEAQINERDANQKSCLHIAAEKGNLAIVAALLQNGADYDSIDNECNNALHIAAKCGHLAIVRELLTESNINAEILNSKGRNALHELCRFGEDQNAASICDLFIESMPKYPINATDMDGNTPLILAFMRGQVQLCKVLVRNGACLGSENHEGISIFNFKLATDQLLHRLLDQLPQESPWFDSDHCQECNNKFSLRIRKHHCRHCGRALCSKCSNNDVPILKFGINKPVRVCGVCFDVLQGLATNPYKIS